MDYLCYCVLQLRFKNKSDQKASMVSLTLRCYMQLLKKLSFMNIYLPLFFYVNIKKGLHSQVMVRGGKIYNSRRGKRKSVWDFKNLQVKSTRQIIFLMILAFDQVTLKSLPVLGVLCSMTLVLYSITSVLFYEWLPSFSVCMKPKQQHNCVRERERFIKQFNLQINN